MFRMRFAAWSPAGIRRSDNGFHHRLDFADLLVAEVGVLFQGAQDHFVQAHVNLNFPGRRFEAFAGQFAGEHFVEDHAERINVGAAVHALRIGLLFGRAVTGSADGALCGVFRGPAGRSGRSSPAVLRPSILAMPKSATFTRPSLSSSRFSGLMSRWTMPRSWANCSASHSGGTMASASSGVNFRARKSWRRFTPSTNSMSRK